MKNIKIPWYIFRIKLPFTTKLITIGNFIIGNIDLLNRPGALQHELFHVKRQFLYFLIPWFIMYIFYGFRRREEILAYEVEVVYLYKSNLQVNTTMYKELMTTKRTYGIKLFKDEHTFLDWLLECRKKATS